MAKNKEGFLIYKGFYEPVKALSNEDMGQLFRWIFEYQINGNEPTNTDRVFMAFQFFKNQFRVDEVKYDKRVEVNKNNGSLGGRPLNPNKPNKTEKTQSVISEPKKADKDKENDKVKDKGKEIVLLNELPFGSDEFIKVWDSWIKFRKEMKKPLKAASIKEQLKFLSNHSEETAIAIITQSIMNGYQGLFPLKANSKQSQQPISKLEQNLASYHEANKMIDELYKNEQ